MAGKIDMDIVFMELTVGYIVLSQYPMHNNYHIYRVSDFLSNSLSRINFEKSSFPFNFESLAPNSV